MTGASPADIAVIGGGLVGAAVAYGLGKAGAAVTLVDAGEDSFHASAGNFGLVWVQGKGAGKPEYAALTRRSADLWDGFAAELLDGTGINPGYHRSGGVMIAISDEEFVRFENDLRRMHNQPPPGDNDTRMIDRADLLDLLPGLGAQVTGASYCPHDGFADPLATLRSLRQALAQLANVRIRQGAVIRIEPQAGGGFVVHAGDARIVADRVVLAAGLGNAALAPDLGLTAPVRPQRGQILVSERVARFLPLACHTLRQTGEGTVLMGDSHEDVGFDRGTTQTAAHAIVGRAVATFPALAGARVIRQWGALRVLTPDGFPIYQESHAHPGAFLVTCHSGVTLAAAHARDVATAVLAGDLNRTYAAFSGARFGEARP